MKLLICSKFTDRYAKDFDYDKKWIIAKSPDADVLKLKNTELDVIAVGGGSVIDTAKIVSKNPIIAVPTTYSGASQTSRAVYWDKGKYHSIKCKKPILLRREEYTKSLDGNLLLYTKMDCLCHLMESFISPRANKKSKTIISKALQQVHKGNWFKASILAGDAIEITGTGFIHGFSYPLTIKYSIPHGAALGIIFDAIPQYPKVKEVVLKTVYVGMAADILHIGHINIINEAKKHGRVILGLLTNEAIESYKETPFSSYEERKAVAENIKGIYKVVPQSTLDYTENLKKYKPDYVVHGDDWKRGIQHLTREKVIKVLKQWNGRLIEMPYTKGISSTKIRKYIRDHEKRV